MSTIILLFTQSHARHVLMSPQPRSELQLHLGVSEGAVVRIFSWDVIRWRYLRTYWSQIKPSQSRKSNTINECVELQRERLDTRELETWLLRSIAAQTHRGDISGSCLFHVTICDMIARSQGRLSSGTNQQLPAYRPCHRSLITSFCSTLFTRSGSMANGVFVLLSDIQISALQPQPRTCTQINMWTISRFRINRIIENFQIVLNFREKYFDNYYWVLHSTTELFMTRMER